MSVLERPTLDDIRYIVEHLTDEDKREWGACSFSDWSQESVVARIARMLDGICHVYRDDGVPYFASGFYISSPGVATAWTIRTEVWKRHLVACVRVSRRVIAELLRCDSVRRLEAWCPGWADKWPAVLGLEKEAVLRRYSKDGTDIVIWSKVKE